MQEKNLFEYAVIRVVPRVEREEFFNVGVMLYCAQLKFLQMLYSVDEQRLIAFCDKCDIDTVNAYLQSFKQICTGVGDVGTISNLPPAERFRWLTATRSTVIQTSKVHPGFCENPLEMLQKLFDQLVS